MYLRLPKATALSVVLALFALGLSACGGPARFTQEDQKNWEKMCPPESTESRALPFDSDCGYRVMTLTGEAACASDNLLGCFLAAVRYENEDSPIRDHDRAVELAEYACDQGDQNGCVALAWVLFQGDRFEKGRAYNLMRHTCMNGMGMSCDRVANWYRHDPDSPKEMKLAAGFFKRSCDLGFAVGCREFAKVYDEGFGVSRNSERAKELYAKACEMGDRRACLEVDRNPPHNKEDMWSEYLGVTNEQFLSMNKTACEHGFKHACTYAGLLIESGNLRGRYITRNFERAAKFFRAGCQKDAPVSCWALALLVREGAGPIEANTKKAVSLAKKSCDQGLQRGCRRYRDYRYRLWDADEAKAWEARCKKGEGEACYLAGRAYNYDVNFDRDTGHALDLLEEGCEDDYFPACEQAGKYYQEGWGTKKSAKQAAHFFKKACDGGTGEACYQLALAYGTGDGVDKDITRGLELSELACKRDVGEACLFAGLRYEYGKGVDKDLDKARDYYGDGCAWRLVRACTHYGKMWRDGKGGEEDDEVARSLFARSCANDDGKACFQLAQMYESGEGAEGLDEDDDPAEEADPIEAADHYEMACLVGHGQSCAELSRLYRKGRGVPKDLAKAKMLREKACMEGYDKVCPKKDKDDEDANDENKATHASSDETTSN